MKKNEVYKLCLSCERNCKQEKLLAELVKCPLYKKKIKNSENS